MQRPVNPNADADKCAALYTDIQKLISEFNDRQAKYHLDCSTTMRLLEQHEKEFNAILHKNTHAIEGGNATLAKFNFTFRSLYHDYSNAHDFEFVPVNYHHSVREHDISYFLNDININVVGNRDRLTKALIAMGRTASVSALLSLIIDQWEPKPADKLNGKSPKSLLMGAAAAPIKFLTNLSMLIDSIVKKLEELLQIDDINFDIILSNINTAKSISGKVIRALAVFNSIPQIQIKGKSTNRRLLVMKKLIDKISRINPSNGVDDYFKVGSDEDFAAALQASIRHDSILKPKHEAMIDDLLRIAAAEADDELAIIDSQTDSYVEPPVAANRLFQPQGILHEVCSYKVSLENKLKNLELNLSQLNNLLEKQSELIAKIQKCEQEHYRLLSIVVPGQILPTTLVKVSENIPLLVDQFRDGKRFSLNELFAWIRRLIKLLNDESFKVRGEQTSPWLTKNIGWLRENVNITTLRVPMAIDQILQHRQAVLQDNTDLLDRYIYLVQENERMEGYVPAMTSSSTLSSI